jgi:hypothetical protein
MRSNKALLWTALLLIGIGALGLFLMGPWTGPINILFNVSGLALAVISFFRDQPESSLPTTTIPASKPQPVRSLPPKVSQSEERPSSKQEDNTQQPTSWSRNATIVYAIIFVALLAETIYYATTGNIRAIVDVYSGLIGIPLLLVTYRLYPKLAPNGSTWIPFLVIAVLCGGLLAFIRDSFFPTPPLRWIIPPIIYVAFIFILFFLWEKYQTKIRSLF